MNELYSLIVGFSAISLLCLALTIAATLAASACAVIGTKLIEFCFKDTYKMGDVASKVEEATGHVVRGIKAFRKVVPRGTISKWRLSQNPHP